MAKSVRGANPIDVVEAAYELDRDDQDLLRNVAAAVRPVIDGGHGITAYFYDLAAPPKTWLERAVLFDVEPAQIHDMTELTTATPRITEVTHLNAQPLASAVEGARRGGFGDVREVPLVRDLFARLGVRDYLALRTIEPGGRGICFTAGQARDCKTEPRSRRLWARVSAHIAAARRLRASLAMAHGAGEIQAVLTPSGKLDHAERDARGAREALRDAVLRQERARGRARRTEPERATEAWTALVSGRWSLVDHFERNGRRYIVARRNEHDVPDPRALTARERAIAHLATLGKSNKLIAYEVGLAESTVGNHLAAAMRKLGASSRVDLIRVIADIAA